MDDATLAQQLVELIGIHKQVVEVSNGVLKAAEATREIVDSYDFIRGTIEEVQEYGPVALWRDFRDDFYDLYPGFDLLDGNTKSWKGSRTKSPAKAYKVVSAVFGDLTGPLKKKERQGNIDTRVLRLRRFESAGALAIAEEAAQATKSYDDDVRHLYRQAETARTGEEADVLSAKASILIAAQNSHIIRLLSRGVRLDGVDAAIDYGRRVKSLNSARRVSRHVLEAGTKLAAPPTLMRFSAPW